MGHYRHYLLSLLVVSFSFCYADDVSEIKDYTRDIYNIVSSNPYWTGQVGSMSSIMSRLDAYLLNPEYGGFLLSYNKLLGDISNELARVEKSLNFVKTAEVLDSVLQRNPNALVVRDLNLERKFDVLASALTNDIAFNRLWLTSYWGSRYYPTQNYLDFLSDVENDDLFDDSQIFMNAGLWREAPMFFYSMMPWSYLLDNGNPLCTKYYHSLRSAWHRSSLGKISILNEPNFKDPATAFFDFYNSYYLTQAATNLFSLRGESLLNTNTATYADWYTNLNQRIADNYAIKTNDMPNLLTGYNVDLFTNSYVSVTNSSDLDTSFSIPSLSSFLGDNGYEAVSNTVMSFFTPFSDELKNLKDKFDDSDLFPPVAEGSYLQISYHPRHFVSVDENQNDGETQDIDIKADYSDLNGAYDFIFWCLRFSVLVCLGLSAWRYLVSHRIYQ